MSSLPILKRSSQERSNLEHFPTFHFNNYDQGINMYNLYWASHWYLLLSFKQASGVTLWSLEFIHHPIALFVAFPLPLPPFPSRLLYDNHYLFHVHPNDSTYEVGFQSASRSESLLNPLITFFFHHVHHYLFLAGRLSIQFGTFSHLSYPSFLFRCDSLRGRVRPSVHWSVSRSVRLFPVIFKGKKSSTYVKNNGTISDDKVVVSHVPPRYLFIYNACMTNGHTLLQLRDRIS